MKSRSLRWLGQGLIAAALTATVAGALPSQAAPWSGDRNNFASPRFEQVWRETDANPGSRSLTWGPRPWFDYREFYRQSPNGLRQVQYFDKARMEINNPANIARSGVTNGLLPVEMVSGRVKLGDATNENENEQRPAAQIPVAGDLAKVNTAAPTYASFAAVATTDNGYKDPNKLNQRIGTTFDKNGNIGFRQDLADQPGTDIVQFATATNHNLPRVFDAYQKSLPVDALVAFGYPISDPYWIRAKVGGVEKDIMVQLFERRVLTYTPSNNDPYKVEMGNVGQHYFQWRYPELGTPWDAPEPTLPIVFASDRAAAGRLELFTTDAQGGAQGQITSNTSGETVPFSIRRSWDKDQLLVYGDSKRDAGGKRQLYVLTPNGSTQTRLLSSVSNDITPAVSPDGTKIAFVSDRSGRAELYLLNIKGTLGLTQLTTNTTACTTAAPSWLPDGAGLVFMSDCTGGTFEIYRADLKYTLDKTNDLQATLANVTRLTNNTTADLYPHVSPNGKQIVFHAERDGNPEIYSMQIDGSLQRRLTSSTAEDSQPNWSPDGTKIVFQSNRDSDFELFIMNASDGSNQVQITNNGQMDKFPVWAQ